MNATHLDHERLIDVITGAADDLDSIVHLDLCVSCADEFALLRELMTALDDDATWGASELEARGLCSNQQIDRSWEAMTARLRRETESTTTTDEFVLGQIDIILAEARKKHEVDARESLSMVDDARFRLAMLRQADPAAVLVRVMLAKAWKERANALLTLGEFPKALEALEHADAEISTLAAAAIDRGSHSYVRAVVLWKMGQLERALLSVKAAAEVFLDYGDTRRLVHAQMLESAVLFESKRYREARDTWLTLLRQSQKDGDHDAAARLFANIGNCYTELGDADSASTFFLQAMGLYKRLGYEIEGVRVRWAMGRSLLRGGRCDEALLRLSEAQAAFENLGMATDAALVALDSAEHLLAFGSYDRVVQITQRLVKVFLEAEMKPASIQAIEYLTEASKHRVAKPALAGAIRTYLEKLPTDPAAEFLPPVM
jgi:tetratricopeptide (TPR) repeat protein